MRIEIPDDDRDSVAAALRSRAAYWRRVPRASDRDRDTASRLDRIADAVERGDLPATRDVPRLDLSADDPSTPGIDRPTQGETSRAELVAVASWSTEPAVDPYEAAARLVIALAGVDREAGVSCRVRLVPGQRIQSSYLHAWQVVLSGDLSDAAQLAETYLAMDQTRLAEVRRLADGDAYLEAMVHLAVHGRGDDRALGRIRCAQTWTRLGWVDARDLSSLHIATLRAAHSESIASGNPVRDAVVRHWCAVAEREDGSVQDDAGRQRAPTDAEVEEARVTLARAWNDARRRNPGDAGRASVRRPRRG